MHTRIGIIYIIIDQYFRLIRTIKIPRTAYHLHSVIPQCRIEYIIPTVSFICMAALEQMTVPLGRSQYQRTFIFGIQYARSIVFQPSKVNSVFAMRNIFLSIVIDKETRIV